MNIYPPDHKPHVSPMWGGARTDCQCSGCQAVNAVTNQTLSSIKAVEKCAISAIADVQSSLKHLFREH